ncbi:pectinacetylesterase family protein [Luteimonas sp. 50]|uniref:Pectinacetylesterase family protein n=1 Tax=Cognatiluteimonas sedimenti TaxID=2927791 RepID=A0ABT0A0B1_9GAMM|nr:pectinacetylesterase family protein [Lysobacter sedimenti]MCJ0824407.1 pectinacetylesterase family protein [Lysobacter sedimenti]
MARQRRPVATAVALAAVAAAVSLALHAEAGDYGYWQTLQNLVNPPPADSPVTPEQRQGPYPLLSNPAGFDDGFVPGDYGEWQTVQLAPETGATCGNGSPYKFFVNRVPGTRNTLVYMEGGGACWDYASCSGRDGVRGARNPDGIPDDYMSIANPAARMVTPFITRVTPFDAVKTQQWNLVYVPYCTGDIYSGDRVSVYDDPDDAEEPLVWHHNGLRNNRAVVAWLKDNLPRPTQMLSAGCSAGGAGSLTNYAVLRRDLAPSYGYLLDDSGPIFEAPRGSDPEQYPQLPLQEHIRVVWGLDAPSGPLQTLAAEMPGFDLDQLGSIYPALSARFPRDRMGHAHFWQDLNYSAYSYERFFPEIENAPDQATREALLHAKWAQDTTRLTALLDGLGNVGGYFPQYRSLNESHCTTIVDFQNGDVQAQALELSDFIDSVLDGHGDVLDASEDSDAQDRDKPFNLLYWLVDHVLG